MGFLYVLLFDPYAKRISKTRQIIACIGLNRSGLFFSPLMGGSPTPNIALHDHDALWSLLQLKHYTGY